MGGLPEQGLASRAEGPRERAEYWHFCLEHVREYNQSYNFFQGMNADAVARYQKDALTGHRPTWKMGANTSANKAGAEGDLDGAADPFHMFAELNGRGRWRPGPGAEAKARDAQGDERRAQGAAGDGVRPRQRSKTSRRSTRRW